jgi:hypothetical protein
MSTLTEFISKRECFLGKHDYKKYSPHYAQYDVLWQKRIKEPLFVCRCNGKLSINIYEWHFIQDKIHQIKKEQEHYSFGVEIHAEAIDGNWYKINRSLHHTELFEELEKVEHTLLQAWYFINTLVPKKEGD